VKRIASHPALNDFRWSHFHAANEESDFDGRSEKAIADTTDASDTSDSAHGVTTLSA